MAKGRCSPPPAGGDRRENNARRRSCAALLTLLLALEVGCAAGGARTSPPAGSAPPAPAAAAGTAADPFFLASDPWINLHHFLYQWARVEARERGSRFRVVEIPERADWPGLAPEEQRAWRAALDAYGAGVAERDLLFDPDLLVAKQSLTRAEATGGAALDQVPASLAAVAAALREAMPVYRRHWWPRHDAANRAWIAAAAPGIRDFAPGLARRLAAAYGGALPAGTVRVDLAAYATWQGAYTTVGPPHITIVSTLPSLQGWSSLESVVHEVSHTDELEMPLRAGLTRAFVRAGVPEPRDLWHVLIFVTAGELTREALAARGIEGFVPYPERSDLYQRNPEWQPLREALDRTWTPYLAKGGDRTAALDDLARAVQGGSQKPP